MDHPDAIGAAKSVSNDDAACDIAFVACASHQNQSESLCELSQLAHAGAAAFYFDRIVDIESLFEQALIAADLIGLPVFLDQ